MLPWSVYGGVKNHEAGGRDGTRKTEPFLFTGGVHQCWAPGDKPHGPVHLIMTTPPRPLCLTAHQLAPLTLNWAVLCEGARHLWVVVQIGSSDPQSSIVNEGGSRRMRCYPGHFGPEPCSERPPILIWNRLGPRRHIPHKPAICGRTCSPAGRQTWHQHSPVTNTHLLSSWCVLCSVYDITLTCEVFLDNNRQLWALTVL